MLETELVSDRLEKLYLENARLKTQIQHILSDKDKEISHLNDKCGCAEYEAQNILEKLQSQEKLYQQESEMMKDKLLKTENELDKLNLQFNTIKHELKEKQETIRRLECYLAGLPTPEEYADIKHQMQNLQDKNYRYKERLKDLEESLSKQDSNVARLSSKIESAKDRERILQSHIDNLNQKLSHDHQRNSSAYKPSPVRVTPDLIEDLKFERDSFRASFEQTKKLLESHLQQKELSEIEQQNLLESLKDQLGREESTVMTLREDLSAKCSELRSLQDTVSKICQEKQDLLEQMLDLKVQADQMIELHASGWSLWQKRLLTYIEATIKQIQCLANVFSKLANGDEMDPSDLLDIPSISLGSDSDWDDETVYEANVITVANIKENVQRLKLLLRDLDAIRMLLSEKYAESLGSHISCITQ